jgi:hypothetical protein
MDQCLATNAQGKPCQARALENGYCSFHKDRGLETVAAEVVTPQPPAQPAKLPNLHRATGTEIPLGHRSAKMLRPICHICAPNTEKAGWGWWKKCPHDPYIGEKGEVIREHTYADELDDSGEVIGRVITGSTQRTVLRPWPNLVPVAFTKRLESGRGPEYKQELFGFIWPQDLRCDAYPVGIAPMCEFRECFYQDELVTYNTGTFCQESEAVVIYEDTAGTVVEVANAQVREDQFAANRAKVRVA